jgi:hypothetical protein
MITYQQTVRVGEWLGLVDPEYDWEQHSWKGRSGGTNPTLIQEGKETILRLAQEEDLSQ